ERLNRSDRDIPVELRDDASDEPGENLRTAVGRATYHEPRVPWRVPELRVWKRLDRKVDGRDGGTVEPRRPRIVDDAYDAIERLATPIRTHSLPHRVLVGPKLRSQAATDDRGAGGSVDIPPGKCAPLH